MFITFNTRRKSDNNNQSTNKLQQICLKINLGKDVCFWCLNSKTSANDPINQHEDPPTGVPVRGNPEPGPIQGPFTGSPSFCDLALK